MSAPDHPPDPPRRRWRLTAALVVTAALVAPLSGSPKVASPNELVRVELALALAMWGTVDLDRPALTYGLSEDVARRDGRVLADKAPGLSLAAVPVVWLSARLLPPRPGSDLPAYWPLRHLLTAVLVVLSTVWLGMGVMPKLSGVDSGATVAVPMLAILATPLWTYGSVFFGHAPAAMLVATAWLLLLGPASSFPKTPDGTGVVPGREPASDLRRLGLALLGGIAAGWAVATEYPTIVLVLVIAVTLVVRRTPLPQLVAVAGGTALGVMPMLVYHQAAFGAPWLTGYAFKADPGFSQIHDSGLVGVGAPTLGALWGVLFSSSRGLFFFSPLLLLAPVGLWLMVRRSGWRDAGPLVVAIGLYIAFASGFSDWRAGWGAAARHLVPAVPLLFVPTIKAASAMARRGWSLFVVVALVALAATRTALTVAVSPFFPPELGHPLTELVLPSLGDGAVAPTILSTLLPLPNWTTPTVLAVLIAGVLIWSLSRLVGRDWRRIAVLFLAVVALQVTWLAWRSTIREPDREQLRAQWLVMVGHEEAGRRLADDLEVRTP